jgi:MFS family permease
MGPAFAVFYVTLGWPIGWLADRANRRNIIAAGIAFWSLATAACGLARSFTGLLFARIGVGIGEAALTPSALSMIADYFPKVWRPRAISVYMMGVYLGSGLAYLVGGAVIAALEDAPRIDVPLYGEVESWQAAFLALGFPGVAVALLVMALREPKRRAGGPLGDEPLSFGDSSRYIGRRWRAFGAPSLGMCATTTITYLMGWNVVLFQRVWTMPIAEIGLWLGVTFLFAGPLGAAASGWLAGRWDVQGKADAAYRVCFIGVAIIAVSATLFPLMPNPALAFVMNAAAMFGSAFATAAGSTSIVAIAPGRVRAQASAIYFMVINLIGLSIGPPLVGVLTDRVFTETSGIAPALMAVAAGAGVPALLALWLGHRSYANEAAKVSGG